MEVQKVGSWVSVSQEALDDAAAMKPLIDEELIEMREALNYWGQMGDVPLTHGEERTGYREFTGTDGKVRQFSVGWRIEQEKRDNEARIEAETAACSYVSCTCGHHED